MTSQGVTWLPNNPSSGVTTGSGVARTGSWGFCEYPHGHWQTPVTDGWLATTAEPIYGVGGWVRTNTPPAALRVVLDGADVGLDDLALSGPYVFVGVLEPDGFTSFEFREMEAAPDDWKNLFADDFVLAMAPATGAPAPAASGRLTVLGAAPARYDSGGPSRTGHCVQTMDPLDLV